MLTALVSRLMILAFGTLYPAYASYKAVRTKDVKEYVKWMMYWIVFALFTFAETFTDVLFSFWFPFYYEIKVAIVFWLLSPATKGSSYLYRNFVHPAFQQRESEIDEMLNKAKEKGYSTVLSIGSKSMSYATNVILQTAMKRGGGIMEHLRKSYSLTDLSPQPKDAVDAPEHMDRLRAPPRGRRQLGGSTVNMSFAEVDVDIRQNNIHNEMLGDVRSTEDISSGYSSTDQLYTEGVLTRSSSVSSARLRGRGRPATRRAVPLPEESEDSDTDQWNECSSVITGVTQTPTPQSIPSGANLEYMTSQTSNSVSEYQSSEHVSNITETVEDKVNKPECPSNVETVENLVNLDTNIKLLSVEANNIIKDLNTCHVINLEAKKSSSQCSISSLNSDKSQDSERKGKYNKPLAPKPPSLEPSKDNLNVDEIKLTETINEVKTSKDDVNVKIDEIKLTETLNEVKAEPREEIKEINLPRTEMRFLRYLDFD